MNRCTAWLLVAALLTVQMLGLMHRQAHAGHLNAPVSQAAEAAAADNAAPPAGRGFLAALFAGHVGGRDCDAFDHVSHADMAFAASFSVSAGPPVAASDVFHPAWQIAAQARGFLARGPPIVA